MIKIRTAQLAAVPSHIRKNLKQIEKEAALARAEGAHILVLPEMCLTGYLIGDLWDQNAFLKECERANEKVAALSKGLTGEALLSTGTSSMTTAVPESTMPHLPHQTAISFILKEALFPSL